MMTEVCGIWGKNLAADAVHGLHTRRQTALDHGALFSSASLQ